MGVESGSSLHQIRSDRLNSRQLHQLLGVGFITSWRLNDFLPCYLILNHNN